MATGQPDDPAAWARERLAELVLREAFDDAAVAELASLGVAATAALIDGAGLDDARARRLALRALALVPSRGAIATLLNAAATESDAELVAICLRGAIAALTSDDAPKVRDFFVSKLGDDDPFVRAAAIDGLATVAATGVRDQLLALAGDDHPFVAERAASALGASETTDDAADDTEGADALLAALASVERDVQRRAIERVLAREDADAFIAEHLAIGHRRIRRALTEAAIARESVGLFDALATRIEDPEVDDDERARALRALRPAPEQDDPVHEKRLDRFGRSPDLFVRAAAAIAAIASTRRATHKVALRGLRDRDAHVRESVARAFEASADTLHGALLPPMIEEIRRLATEAEGPDDEQVAATLIRALDKAVKAGAWVDERAATAVSPWTRAFGATTREAARTCYDTIRGVDAATDQTEETSIAQDLASDDDARVEGALDRLVDDDAAAAAAHVDALLELLYRAPISWRARIATVLGRTTSSRALRAVERLAASDHADVASAASAALEAAPAPTPETSAAATQPRPSDGASAGAAVAEAGGDDNPYGPVKTPDAPLPPSKSWGEPWQ